LSDKGQEATVSQSSQGDVEWEGQPRMMPHVATIPTNHKEVRALTVIEVAALRAGLRQWEADKKQAGRYPTVDILDVIDIMLATGARIREALAIWWKDVDLKSEKPTATVNGTIVYMPKQGLTIQDHPKSANSRQRYFLPSFAVEMLLRLSLPPSLATRVKT
jgi:integrase